MRRSRNLIPSLFVSFGLLSLLAPRVAADEQLPLRGAGELVANSDETRRRLLTTELAVSRELIELVRSRLVQESETQKLSPEVAARMAMVVNERMRAALQTLKQLDSSPTMPSWLEREELSLQVLLAARAVDDAQHQLQEATLQPAVVLQPRRELLGTVGALLSRQLALAKVSNADTTEFSKISRQWLDVEQRAKALNDKFEGAIASGQLPQIQELSVEAQQLIEQSQPLVAAAWDLCKEQLNDQHDDAAILSHANAIRSHSDGVLAFIDAVIVKTLPSEPEAAKLRSLQIKKLAILREHLLSTEREVREGFDRPYRDYLQALDENFGAELDLCKTKDERVSRCRQHVRRLEDALRIAEAENRAAVRSRYDWDRTKIALVTAEISLEREQSRDESK
jgi:hypothetical protein